MEGYEAHENDQVNQSDETYGDSGDEHIYVAEGDLDGIYEEKDMLEALASYREVRQALKEQKTSRGFFPGKGVGAGKSNGKGKSRIQKEQLKLRTRCWRCGQIGHISAECTSKMVVKDGGSQASSNGSTGKSSFFVSTADDVGVATAVSGETSQFWLRNFVERRAKTRHESPREAEAVYKGAADRGSNKQENGFHGIVSSSFEGVADTAAEGGLIGSLALERLQSELQHVGLCCRWTPKTSAAKGVGGQARVVGVILIPLGIGGINGVLETTVVEGDVPVLLPIRLLKALDAIINIPENHVFFGKHAVKVPMKELSSGHLVINITEFAQAGFEAPEELKNQYEFRCGMVGCATTAVMLAQQRLQSGTTNPRSVHSSGTCLTNGWTGWSNPELGKPKAAPEPTISSFRRAAQHSTSRAIKNWRVILDKICTLLVMVALQEAIGDWCPQSLEQASMPSCETKQEDIYAEIIVNAPAMKPIQSKELTTGEFGKQLCASQESNERWWKQPSFLDSVPRLQLQMGEPISCNGSSTRLEAREPREETRLLGPRPSHDQCSRGHGSGDGYGRGSECQPGLPLCRHDHGHECGAGGTEFGVQDVGSSGVNAAPDVGSNDADDGRMAESKGDILSGRSAPEAAVANSSERDEREVTEAGDNVSSDATHCHGNTTNDIGTNGECSHGDGIRGRSLDCPGSFSGTTARDASSLPLPSTSGKIDCEEGRPEKGQDILEMHTESLRVLSIGCSGTTAADECSAEDPSGHFNHVNDSGGIMAASGNQSGCGGVGLRCGTVSPDDSWTVCCTRYNLRVDGENLNKKPTGLLLNSEEMANHLGRRCLGDHAHQPSLHGLAKKAQKYKPEFCRAVLQGLKKQMIKDRVVHREEEIWAVSQDLDLADDEDEEVCPVEEGEAEGSHQITEEEKAMVKKLHRNVEHPQNPEFIRYMRAGRVRPEVIRWTAKEFKCDVCEAKQHPKAARPAAIPRSYQPNKVIGVDITYVPLVGGGGVIPVLNVLDWGTNYQMMEKLDGKQPQEAWEALQQVWFRVFGVPEIIVTDQGKEFSLLFQSEAAKLGILAHQTAARAPWQQGRTERHGSIFKDILEKARTEEVITTEKELVALMREVEQARIATAIDLDSRLSSDKLDNGRGCPNHACRTSTWM
eukprot:s847_g12.t1